MSLLDQQDGAPAGNRTVKFKEVSKKEAYTKEANEKEADKVDDGLITSTDSHLNVQVDGALANSD